MYAILVRTSKLPYALWCSVDGNFILCTRITRLVQINLKIIIKNNSLKYCSYLIKNSCLENCKTNLKVQHKILFNFRNYLVRFNYTNSSSTHTNKLDTVGKLNQINVT